MKRNLLFKILALVAIVLLSLPACSLPTPLPTCTAEQLQMPIDLAPDYETVDPAVLVDLTWKYPSTTCSPDFFEVYVWTGLEPETPGMTGRVDYADPLPSGGWKLTWPVPLQPGNSYFFRVSAGLETGPGPDVHGPKAISVFFTGPECAADETYQPVVLSNPPDDSVVDPNEDITFVWDDPTSCLVHGLFEIQLSLHEDFSEYWHRIPILQTTYTPSDEDLAEQLTPWLQNCTRYYWRVKTDPAGPPEEPFSEVWSFLAKTPGTLCPIDLIQPFGVAQLDLNCRSGPGPLYEVVGALPKGAEAPIQGRNADGSWWQILDPKQQLCWVWGEQFDEQGDLSRVVVVTVAPPPEPTATFTPVPVNCAQYTDPQTCQANPACTWYKGAVGAAGYCKNK